MRKNKKGQIIYKSLFHHEKKRKNDNLIGYVVVDKDTNALWTQDSIAKMYQTKKEAMKCVEFVMAFFAHDVKLLPVYANSKVMWEFKL